MTTAVKETVDWRKALEPTYADRRSSRRYQCHALVICGRFNGETTFQAVMRNYGNGGLYLESPYSLNAGTAVHLRMACWPVETDRPAPEPCRTASLGEVRWCKPVGDPKSPRYGIGIKFY